MLFGPEYLNTVEQVFRAVWQTGGYLGVTEKPTLFIHWYFLFPKMRHASSSHFELFYYYHLLFLSRARKYFCTSCCRPTPNQEPAEAPMPSRPPTIDDAQHDIKPQRERRVRRWPQPDGFASPASTLMSFVAMRGLWHAQVLLRKLMLVMSALFSGKQVHQPSKCDKDGI